MERPVRYGFFIRVSHIRRYRHAQHASAGFISSCYIFAGF
ncbi:unnamed protein product [Callosobruchus maculatus]|uniref:Uncharacterized protein n=1 Tax=Callosobruchus maculatus TaxID=64391 RepID=A0A653C2J4_CALMS|nr:unnamed protein product [Callosobruchus maculatus]